MTRQELKDELVDYIADELVQRLDFKDYLVSELSIMSIEFLERRYKGMTDDEDY